MEAHGGERGVTLQSDRLMWVYREHGSSLSNKSEAKILSSTSARGNLPVKTFILTCNYNLASHHQEEKFTMHDIAMGYRDKLSLISTFVIAKQIILLAAKNVLF